MILVLRSVLEQRQLNISVDRLAETYGFRGPVSGTLVYENDTEFLESLDPQDDDPALD